MSLTFEGTYGVSLASLKPTGRKGDGSLYYTCPRCKGRKKLEVKNQLWFCHKCGIGGSVKRDKPGLVFLDEPVSQVHQYTPVGEDSAQWAYLSRFRDLPDRLIRDLRPHVGPSPVRVSLPVYDYGEADPCYFVSRAIFEGFERYWNPPLNSFPKRKSQVVWGLHRGGFPTERLVVCEGIFDAVWSPNRIALLGCSISDTQVELIPRLVNREVVVMLDGEARPEAAVVARKISKVWGGRISLVRLPYGCDPDSMHQRGLGDVVEKWVSKREVIA